MANLQQMKEVAARLYLDLDNPDSVRQQLKRIVQAQTELRQLRQEVRAELQQLNRPTNSFGLDEAASIGLHLFGKHRVARAVTR